MLLMKRTKATAPPNAAQRRKKTHKLYCLSLQGLHCELRRAAPRCAVPRREMKSGKSLYFTTPHFFGVALWPIKIARRVTCRKNNHALLLVGLRLLNVAVPRSLVGP